MAGLTPCFFRNDYDVRSLPSCISPRLNSTRGKAHASRRVSSCLHVCCFPTSSDIGTRVSLDSPQLRLQVSGIVQGKMDNRWFISALNIVAANRVQLDRVFFGELDVTWVQHGFFVCKFYKDDPYSDDDWQVGV